MSSEMKGKHIFLAPPGQFGRGKLPECLNMLACRNNFLAGKDGSVSDAELVCTSF